MQVLADISRIGEKILDRLVAIILILVILFAGYSLWNSYMLYRGGFAALRLGNAPQFFRERGRLK